MNFLLSFILILQIPDENVKILESMRIENNYRIYLQHLLWSFQGIDDMECVSEFFDVNNDGYPDVLAESYDAGATGNAHFFCLSGNSGETIWAVWPQGGLSNSGGWGDQCISYIPDLNNDGYGDALLGTAWGGRTIFAISGYNGSTIWSYNTYNDPYGSGWVYSINPLRDIDGDSVWEVIAGVGTTCQTVFCFSGRTGNIIWRFRAEDAIGSVHSIRDVNNDNYDDVLAGAWGNGTDRRIYCISGNSRGNNPTILWSFNTGGDVYCVRPIPDVNGNGIDDALASSWSNIIFCLEGSSGQVIWQRDIGNDGMRIEVLDDINGDSIWEVIVGSMNYAVILLDGRTGNEIWRRPTGGMVWTVYPIGDVNLNGKKDVVAGCGDGNIYLLEGSNGQIIWQYNTVGWVNSVRSINDVNGDNLDDVLAGNQFQTQPGFVYCLEGDTFTTSLKENKNLPKREFNSIFDATGRKVEKLKYGIYFWYSNKLEKLVILKRNAKFLH